jgi:hypothetical protein
MGVLIDEVAHGPEVCGILGECHCDGSFECAGAVAGEQLSARPSERRAALDNAAHSGHKVERTRLYAVRLC